MKANLKKSSFDIEINDSTSMRPFLKDHDRLIVSPEFDLPLANGAIYLFRDQGEFITHRYLKSRGFCGDNTKYAESIDTQKIFGLITGIKRKSKSLSWKDTPPFSSASIFLIKLPIPLRFKQTFFAILYKAIFSVLAKENRSETSH